MHYKFIVAHNVERISGGRRASLHSTPSCRPLDALVGQRNDAGREMIHPNPSTKSYRGGEAPQ